VGGDIEEANVPGTNGTMFKINVYPGACLTWQNHMRIALLMVCHSESQTA